MLANSLKSNRQGLIMNIITVQHLSNYTDDIANRLNWLVSHHAKIYKKVSKNISQGASLDKSLDFLEESIFSWFTRKGSISPNWRNIILTATKKLQDLEINLPDLNNQTNLTKVIYILKPLGQVKILKSKRNNYMPASKILNFIFPQLIPKIDWYWIKDVCLRKVNTQLSKGKLFRMSQLTSIEDYGAYLQFAANQTYDPLVMTKLEEQIGIKNAYAVAFEYCLLGFYQIEIHKKLSR